jgi:hypothetical protein
MVYSICLCSKKQKNKSLSCARIVRANDDAWIHRDNKLRRKSWRTGIIVGTGTGKRAGKPNKAPCTTRSGRNVAGTKSHDRDRDTAGASGHPNVPRVVGAAGADDDRQVHCCSDWNKTPLPLPRRRLLLRIFASACVLCLTWIMQCRHLRVSASMDLILCSGSILARERQP